MEIAGFIGTIIGMLISIASAIITVQQARKSKIYANEIEQIRDRFLNVTAINDIANVNQELHRTINMMNKYGSSSSISTIGLSNEDDIRCLNNFILVISENRYLFENVGCTNMAKPLIKSLKKLVISFADSDQENDKHKIGREIMFKLVDFTSILKELSDSTNQQTIVCNK